MGEEGGGNISKRVMEVGSTPSPIPFPARILWGFLSGYLSTKEFCQIEKLYLTVQDPKP